TLLEFHRPTVDGEVHRGGAYAASLHLQERVKAAGKVREGEPQQGALLGLWKDLEGGFGDDTQSAFGADEELGEIRTSRALAQWQSAHDLAGAQNDLEAEHLRAHRAVASAQLAEPGCTTATGGCSRVVISAKPRCGRKASRAKAAQVSVAVSTYSGPRASCRADISVFIEDTVDKSPLTPLCQRGESRSAGGFEYVSSRRWL